MKTDTLSPSSKTSGGGASSAVFMNHTWTICGGASGAVFVTMH